MKTPEEAWDLYVDNSIKLFRSYFFSDGITDVKEMCKIYAKDLPNATGHLFSQDQIDRLEKLFLQYIENTGYDEDDIYTKEELNEFWEKDVAEIIGLLKKFQK